MKEQLNVQHYNRHGFVLLSPAIAPLSLAVTPACYNHLHAHVHVGIRQRPRLEAPAVDVSSRDGGGRAAGAPAVLAVCGEAVAPALLPVPCGFFDFPFRSGVCTTFLATN